MNGNERMLIVGVAAIVAYYIYSGMQKAGKAIAQKYDDVAQGVSNTLGNPTSFDQWSERAGMAMVPAILEPTIYDDGAPGEYAATYAEILSRSFLNAWGSSAGPMSPNSDTNWIGGLGAGN